LVCGVFFGLTTIEEDRLIFGLAAVDQAGGGVDFCLTAEEELT